MRIAGVSTYVATLGVRASNGNELLYFSDAFGMQIDSFVTMDDFAICNYLTLGVDNLPGFDCKVEPCVY